MVRSKKSTALNKETTLENALKQDNVVDMRLFFQYHKKSDDYWMSAMILGIDNIADKQKIALARRVITDENALGFFFRKLYGVEDD